MFEAITGALGKADPLMSQEVAPRQRVVLAGHHTMMVDMLRGLIEPEFDVVDQVGDGPGLVEITDRLQPDIVLLDIDLPGVSGLDAAFTIRQRHAGTKLLFIAVDADAALAAKVFAIGASGLLLKRNRSLEVLEALRTVAAGGHYLTRLVAEGDMAALSERSLAKQPLPLSGREIEVLSLLVRGLPMKEVARRLGITARTVAFHKYNAMNVLGLRGNADLLEFAMRNKLLSNVYGLQSVNDQTAWSGVAA